MKLTPFRFSHSTQSGVSLAASDGPVLVQVFIPADLIDAYFNCARALERQALIMTNLEIFGKISTAKYERGDYTIRELPGLVFAQIRLSLFEVAISDAWYCTGLARDEQPFYKGSKRLIF